ncbi:MAG: ABC transporter permease [Ignisphaera sp.]|nr:ABC transporter permease [Ignisphaera sp.]MCX8167400.1 ABC transporter permease [Ignisphaera sp.]MDW8085944.1 ABC transporter permease [Ignisphaera sp.]
MVNMLTSVIISIKNQFLTLMKINTKFRVGSIIIIAVVALALLSFLSPSQYIHWYSYPRNVPPTLKGIDFILGTTANGRSVFWIFTNAIKNSLVIGLVTALIAPHVGLLIGIIAGLRGGVLDKVLMFITDTIIVIPALPLYIIVLMILKPYISAIGNPIPFMGLIFSITAWCWPARQVRAMVLSLREREFILTSSLSGNSIIRIIFREITPHLLAWHLINLTNTVLYSIGMETGLSILGLSILDKDTLGTMIYWSLYYSALFRGLWWWYITPIVGVIVVFLAFFLISQGISEYVNPRLRQ